MCFDKILDGEEITFISDENTHLLYIASADELVYVVIDNTDAGDESSESSTAVNVKIEIEELS